MYVLGLAINTQHIFNECQLKFANTGHFMSWLEVLHSKTRKCMRVMGFDSKTGEYMRVMGIAY